MPSTTTVSISQPARDLLALERHCTVLSLVLEAIAALDDSLTPYWKKARPRHLAAAARRVLKARR